MTKTVTGGVGACRKVALDALVCIQNNLSLQQHDGTVKKSQSLIDMSELSRVQNY